MRPERSKKPRKPVRPTARPASPRTSSDDITQLLLRMQQGDERATGELFTAVYDLLRDQARTAMRGQPRSHTLQATALVGETFLKLVRPEAKWTGRRHFLSVAARAMRSVLVDHARAKSRRKRTAAGRRLALDELLVTFEDRSFEMLDLDDALRGLAERSERAARVVELRFFGGLSLPDVAENMAVPLRTVERDWEYARAWLHAELS